MEQKYCRKCKKKHNIGWSSRGAVWFFINCPKEIKEFKKLLKNIEHAR